MLQIVTIYFVYLNGLWTHFHWMQNNQQMEDRDAIQKTFEFTDFNQAWSFMTRSALEAEKVRTQSWLIFKTYNFMIVMK